MFWGIWKDYPFIWVSRKVMYSKIFCKTMEFKQYKTIIDMLRSSKNTICTFNQRCSYQPHNGNIPWVSLSFVFQTQGLRNSCTCSCLHALDALINVFAQCLHIVRFLSGVDTHVSLKVTQTREVLLAFGASVQFISGVNTMVAPEVLRLRESAAARLTDEWFLSGVGAPVLPKGADFGEMPVAELTSYGFSPVCVRDWATRLPRFRNRLSQRVHANGCSPVCMRACRS